MDRLSSVPRLLVTCLGILGLLAIGAIGGMIVSGVVVPPPVAADEGCETDECETSGILWWKHRHCADNPGSDTSCRMDGEVCVSDGCHA